MRHLSTLLKTSEDLPRKDPGQSLANYPSITLLFLSAGGVFWIAVEVVKCIDFIKTAGTGETLHVFLKHLLIGQTFSFTSAGRRESSVGIGHWCRSL